MPDLVTLGVRLCEGVTVVDGVLDVVWLAERLGVGEQIVLRPKIRAPRYALSMDHDRPPSLDTSGASGCAKPETGTPALPSLTSCHRIAGVADHTIAMYCDTTVSRKNPADAGMTART